MSETPEWRSGGGEPVYCFRVTVQTIEEEWDRTIWGVFARVSRYPYSRFWWGELRRAMLRELRDSWREAAR